MWHRWGNLGCFKFLAGPAGCSRNFRKPNVARSANLYVWLVLGSDVSGYELRFMALTRKRPRQNSAKLLSRCTSLGNAALVTVEGSIDSSRSLG